MSKGTKNVFDLEEYRRIWVLLETTFSDNENEKAKIAAFLNGQQMKSSDEVRNALKSDNEGVMYSIECTYQLYRKRELLGENYVGRQVEQISKKLKDLEKPAKSRIDKVYVVFLGDELDDGLFQLLNERKDPTQEKLVIKFRFSKDISDFVVPQNDRKGWCDIWRRLKERLASYPADEYALCIDLPPAEDMTNLRYFVPLWHHFRKENRKIRLKIQTDTLQEENRKEDRYYAVSEFFSCIPKIKSYILVNGVQLGNGGKTGDMPPLLYYHENEDVNGTDKYDNFIRDYVVYLAVTNNYAGTTSDKTSDKTKRILRLELFEFLLDKLDAVDSFNLEEEISHFEKLGDIIYTKLFKIIHKKKIELTLLIFLIIMRSRLKDKSLIDSFQMENPDQRAIDKALFEAIWTNAKTNAEGLQQIIENAQEHSCGKIAYFGMRIHRASPNGSMSQLVDQVDTRKRLWERFWHDSDFTNNIFNERVGGKAVYPDFIEFFVLDDAIEGLQEVGIVGRFNRPDESGKCTSHPIKAIKDIFELTENDYSTQEEKLQLYIRHYGMRWFKQHIENLNGLMEIYSPCPEGDADKCIYSNCFSESGGTWFSDYGNLYSTEYSVLVPLAYSFIPHKREPHLRVSERLFLPFFNGQPRHESMNLQSHFDAWRPQLNAHTKLICIEKMYDEFIRQLEKNAPKEGLFNEQILFELDASNLQSGLEVEVLVKAIFQLIFIRKLDLMDRYGGSIPPQLFLAARFSKRQNSEFAKEFIRIFTIFYLKQVKKEGEMGIPQYMQDVQIAICSDAEIPEVNFILGGGNLRSAYTTANNFAYYNADASLDFVPLLDFLSVAEENEKGKKDGDYLPIPLFPFDLYLKDGEGKSWFEKQMCRRLETDLRTREYGCKISDIRIRLGSKIYIDTFYEAELLFHNVGTVKRFAYLIARDIYETYRGKAHEGTLFLLGYENYSSILVQEVHALLIEALKSEWKRIEWLIETHSEDYPVLSFDKFSQGDLQEIAKAEKLCCITILPLGSTMTTLYKLHDAFSRGLRRFTERTPAFIANYCLVAIGNAYSNPKQVLGNKGEEIPQRYLDLDGGAADTFSEPWSQIHLKQNSSKTDGETVKFLLSAGAVWLNPNKNDEDKPLLRVDKTSTLLDTIFQTPLSGEVINYYTRNEDGVKCFKPKGRTSFFRYGHIVRGENHYQFYFDFEKLVQVRRKKIVDWAKTRNKYVEPDAFNIVISPLQITNSEFLKIVTDCAFGSNLHLLHINIQGSGKETVRTKFDYISTEFSKITQQHRKINLYYVDDCICTGNGLARAWKFLVALCDQTGQRVEAIFPQGLRFKKIFLLVNRSSYETAQMWTMDPQKDWLAFIDLCIPSYNTHMSNDVATCPECKVRDRYELLRKRSAANHLIEYFGKRAVKCEARNPQEYDFWLRNRILTEPSYFSWLCEWVYFKKDKTDKLYKKLKNHLITDGARVIQALGLSETELDVAYQMTVEDDFLRMQSMDRAYRQLLYDAELQSIYQECLASLGKQQPSSSVAASDAFDPYRAELKKRILLLLADCFKNKNTYDAVLGFISYIKVISRDYLAKNYFIKETMYRILYDIFGYMIDLRNRLKAQYPDENRESFLTILHGIYGSPLLFRYRIFKVITHRLSLVRSTELIYVDTMKKILDTYNALKKREDAEGESDEHLFLPLPSVEDMQISYLASVKTAAIEENNDNVCIALLNTAEDFSEEKPAESGLDKSRFKNQLFLENTRVLFGFMQELSNCCGNYIDPIDGNWKYSGYTGKGSLSEREELVIRLLKGDSGKKECVSTLLDHCYSSAVFQGQFDEVKVYYHNPLNTYLQFYWKAFCEPEEDGKAKEYLKIAEMLNYFNILRYLTEPKFREKRHENFGYLPYIFEDLCISIRNMTQTKACYLVYKKEGESAQSVARSGYTVGNDEELFSIDGNDNEYSSLHIGSTQFDQLIAKLRDEDSIIDGVSCIQTIDESENSEESTKQHFLVFEFPFGQGGDYNEDEQGRKCYLFLETGDITIKERRRIAMRVLFLRNRLWEALKENYAAVLNYRFHCNYIQPIVPSDLQRGSERLSILHLSDLHLSDDESWAQGSDRLKTLCKEVNRVSKLEGSESKCIDFLAVTGDIVHGSDSAATAQKKYKRAANLLFEIAKNLWGMPEGEHIILPHDWKRRIVITTGNHDYAVMNDMRVLTESRRIMTGLPAVRSGGTMSKYTYFIEFLSYFLDAPTSKLLKQDLNEIREYKHFGLVMGVFNSCANANALQNNKVMYNQKQVDDLCSTRVWKEAQGLCIVFSHHSPHYVIDYFADKYGVWKYQEDNHKQLYNAYISRLVEFLNDNSYILASDLEKAKEYRFEWLSSEKSFEILFPSMANKKKKDSNSKELNDLLESGLYKDMEMLYHLLKAKKEYKLRLLGDEYALQFLSTASDLFKAMIADNKLFKEQFVIINCHERASGILNISGHEHKAKHFNVEGDIPETFVGHMLYSTLKDIPKQAITFEIIARKDEEWIRDIHSYINEAWYFESHSEEHRRKIAKELGLKSD